ncbi:DUF2283 domain-containing protein [Sphingomonas sp. AAP5]|uniref:DUF2283 domain-containing protein n=1 Tax=Sphingomonas sp. AAP5 TaxID=1523415 RepID=UPI0010575C8D|nr:DUF2283 domain-containing protein [Sphingomonas sp. AAP5]QBM75798.1 DUF2283 domain-containing protein [Sphingomonas sp. AAP5]
MKLHYYPETDSLYIELRNVPGAETREVADGVNIDLDADGAIVGIDIDRASTQLDLATLEMTSLPQFALRAA